MNTEQAIQKWLELCPCDNWSIEDEHHPTMGDMKLIKLYPEKIELAAIHAKRLDDWLFQDYEESES